MTDLAAIRARHAEYDRVPRATGFNSSVDQAHADRAALLAALARLAEVGVEDVARVIAETPSEYPSGIVTIWHGLPWAETSPANQATYRAMATAVLTLLRARVPGPGPV